MVYPTFVFITLVYDSLPHRILPARDSNTPQKVDRVFTIFTMNNVLLDLLALGAILSGIMVITAKNPVISVLFLISVFVNVAGYLVLLGVAYLGLVYLIVYVGAIAILFLFVIMMLNLRLVELVDTGQEYTKNLPMGAFLGSLFFFELLSILPVNYHDGGSLHVPLSIFN